MHASMLAATPLTNMRVTYNMHASLERGIQIKRARLRDEGCKKGADKGRSSVSNYATKA